jgi:putative thioredoxin
LIVTQCKINLNFRWCAPCKKLYPLLEKKLEENKNFKLVKINIDENGDLAEQLSISSVPSVFLVYKGNVIDNFVGLPDMKKLDQFFESITLIKGIGEDEKIIQAMLAGADEYMSKKIYDRAENMLNEAYSHQKWRNKYGHIIKLALGMCAFNRSDFKLAEKFTKDLKLNHKNDISLDPHLNKKLSLLEMKLDQISNPEIVEKSSSEILNKIEENPKDLNLRYQLAQLQFDNSQYEEAINTLLEIIAIDRNWKEKTAQKFLIQIFNFLGQDNKLTTQGRQKLTKLLY